MRPAGLIELDLGRGADRLADRLRSTLTGGDHDDERFVVESIDRPSPPKRGVARCRPVRGDGGSFGAVLIVSIAAPDCGAWGLDWGGWCRTPEPISLRPTVSG